MLHAPIGVLYIIIKIGSFVGFESTNSNYFSTSSASNGFIQTMSFGSLDCTTRLVVSCCLFSRRGDLLRLAEEPIHIEIDFLSNCVPIPSCILITTRNFNLQIDRFQMLKISTFWSFKFILSINCQILKLHIRFWRLYSIMKFLRCMLITLPHTWIFSNNFIFFYLLIFCANCASLDWFVSTTSSSSTSTRSAKLQFCLLGEVFFCRENSSVWERGTKDNIWFPKRSFLTVWHCFA